MRKIYTIGLLVFVLLSSGCMKDNTGIPNVLIDIPPISLQDPRYSNLLAPNSSVSIEGGVAGIIIYNTGSGYVAYDRCSTVNPEKRCAVEVDETGFNLVDPCSGGKFQLETGFPSKAPAEKALKAYRVIVTGNGYLLRITN